MATSFALIELLGILMMSGSAAFAQTPPTQAKPSTYCGLHAVAAKGAVDEIQRQVQAGADLNARDGKGRTPL